MTKRLNTGDYRYVPISYPADKNRRSRVCTLHLHRENKFHVNSRKTGLWDVSEQPDHKRVCHNLPFGVRLWCLTCVSQLPWEYRNFQLEWVKHTEAERLMTYGVRAWTGINPLSVYTGKASTIREDTLHPQNDVFRSSSTVERSDTSDNITLSR